MSEQTSLVWSELTTKVKQLKGVLAIAPSVAGLVIAGSLTGIYQTLEWSVLDQWFQLRPRENKDSRIVVVEIDESNISELNGWSISNGVMAELLTKIKRQQPRVIGLALDRNLKDEKPGRQKLEQVFRTTPNIIGVEKAVSDWVKSSKSLEEISRRLLRQSLEPTMTINRVSIADLVLDADGKVRRALISAEFDNGKVALGLGALTALVYLKQDGVLPEKSPDSDVKILGQANLSALQSNSAAYINAPTEGYQTLLNYRGDENSFLHISLTDVLEENSPDDFFRDRLVLIGATASSLNDFVSTPYNSKVQSSQQMPGVYVHANIASQIISAAVDGRTMLKSVSETKEWFWILGWSFVGGGLSYVLFQTNLRRKDSFNFIKPTVIGIVVPVGILLTSSYLLFLSGYWLPTIAPLLALVVANLTVTGYYYQNHKRIAFTDDLTKIANRRFFDRFLAQQWSKCQREHQDLAIILCDVDFFKIYNDIYGQQEGDVCLQKVALALNSSVRSSDLAARYGGEEFVVVLPDSNTDTAKIVAERIRSKLKAMQIPHSGANASKCVSLSMGIASLDHNQVVSAEELLEAAERALCQAKEQGRDRAIVCESSE